MTEATPTLARRIAEAVLSPRWAALPADIQARVRRSTTDYLGCAIAGAALPEWQVARALAEPGSIEVPGLAERFDPRGAAVVLGTTGALLQLHDVYALGGIHPSNTVFPAAWVAWKLRGGTQAEFLAALAAGYETANRLSGATYPHQQLAGSTPTSTMGTIGAAVAAGRLFGLDAAGLATAIGNATVLTPLTPFETLRRHGSAVPIHGGAAARAGLEAVMLAAGGWSAGSTALEGSEGFPGWLHIISGDPARIVPENWDGSTFDQMVWKIFPTCFACHPAVEAALRLPKLNLQAVRRVRISMGKGPMVLVANGPEAPGELYDRLMSVRWAVGRAMLDGGFDMDSPGRADDAALAALMNRMEVTHDPAIDPLGPVEVAAGLLIERDDGPPIHLAHRRKRIGDSHDGHPLGWLHAADAPALDAKYASLTRHAPQEAAAFQRAFGA